jgi:hypothetical protein
MQKTLTINLPESEGFLKGPGPGDWGSTFEDPTIYSSFKSFVLP